MTVMKIKLRWQILFLVILAWSHMVQPILEMAFPGYENTPVESVKVTLLEARRLDVRSKRELNSCYADVLSFSTTVDGQSLTLELEENTHIATNVPVYAMDESGQITKKAIPMLKEIKCYQDLINNAAIGVAYERMATGECKYELEGTFSMGKGMYLIQPMARSANRAEANHNVRLVNMTTDFRGDFSESESPPGWKFKPKKRPRHPKFPRNKRQTVQEVYTVDMFFICDDLIVSYWFNRSPGSTPEEKLNNALQNVDQYLAYLVNGLDLRYRHIDEVDMTFRVQMVGYLVVYEYAAPWTTDIATVNANNAERPLVVGLHTLQLLKEWIIMNAGILPDLDHTMLFTKADLVHGGSTSTAGLANIGVTCTTSSVSVVEDLFHAVTIEIAAHELGHSLSALHDGDNNTCAEEDKFIMAVTSGRSEVNPQNPWYFSDCSVQYFREYIDLLDLNSANCLLNKGDNNSALDPLLTVLPGQFYDIDTQCTFSMGNTSSACRVLYIETIYPTSCSETLCYEPFTSTCLGIFPARGTTCGDAKWCIDGVCVQDASAPSAPDSCPWGNTPGIVPSTTLTCDEITTQTYQCYSSFYLLACCESCRTVHTGNPECPYGDRIVTCQAIDRRQCYLTDVESTCCGTCPPLKDASQVGCEYGDRSSACVVENCNHYNEPTRTVTCCETCAENVCNVAGTRYADGEFSTVNACLQCNSSRDTTALSIIAGTCLIGDSCFNNGNISPTDTCLVCVSATDQTQFSARENVCNVAGTCYADGVSSSVNTCLQCDISRNTTALSIIGDNCFIEGKCYTNTEAHTSRSCQVCNTALDKNDFSIKIRWCYIGGNCYSDGDSNPANTCEICSSDVNNLDFTQEASPNVCTVDGQCYANGATSDTLSCLYCNVALSNQALSIHDNMCYISETCYSDGAINPNDQRETCQSSQNKGGFTVSAAICAIGGVTYLRNDRNQLNGCEYCQPDSSTNSWTHQQIQLRLADITSECSNVCTHFQNNAGIYLTHICSSPSYVNFPGFLDSFCLVQDIDILTVINCDISSTTVTRVQALCKNTPPSSAIQSSVVCI